MKHGLFRRAAFVAAILFAVPAALPAAPQGLASGDLLQSYELLTTREREILQLFAEGKTVKEVAAMPDLSVYTVETHRSNIFQKLGLHSVAELILYAVRKGVIS